MSLSNSTSLSELIEYLESQVAESLHKVGSGSGPNGILEHISSFIAAVNWKADRWIACLLLFHLLLFISIIVFKRHLAFQVVSFLIICLLVSASEPLNSYCSVHWKSFSSQNYFDKSGSFAGIFFSGPFLVIAFVQLVRVWLKSTHDVTSPRFSYCSWCQIC